jgi:hypothetical protein
MLPASDLTAILANLSALHLQPNTAAQILAAVLAPLLRSSESESESGVRHPRSGRPRSKLRKAARRKRKKTRPRVAAASTDDDPRGRAHAALKANPGIPLAAVARIAGVSRSTVCNARGDLAAERKPRETSAPSPVLAKQNERRRQHAQQWLREQLADGPQRVSDIEAAAEKARLDVNALERARADLGIVPSRANACSGSTLSVQWALPA